MTPPVRFALGIASTGHALCHGAKVLLPVVLSPAAAALGVSLMQMGVAVAVYSLAMGIASVPAGLLSDRIGTARVVTLFFWATAAASAMCALPLGYGGFLVAHALLGAATGLYHPAGLGLLSLTAAREQLGRAFGLHGVAGSVGIAAAPFAIAALVSPLGWRGGFVALAVVAALAGVASIALRRRGLIYDAVPPARDGEPVSALMSNSFLCLLAVISVNAFLLDGFTTMFPETVRTRGVFIVGDYTVMAGILALGGIGQYVGGMIASGPRASARYAFVVAVQPLLFLFTALTLDEAVMPFVLLGAFAFTNYMTQPIENHMLASFTARARRGVAYASKFLVALVLASPAPWVVTVLAVESGEETMYGFLAGAGVLGFVAAALLLRARPAAA